MFYAKFINFFNLSIRKAFKNFHEYGPRLKSSPPDSVKHDYILISELGYGFVWLEVAQVIV